MSAARLVRSAIEPPPSSPSAGALRRLGSADWCEAAEPGHGERVLVVVSGLPGTGKSTVAAALAARLRAVQLSIDPIEDALLGAGLPPSWEVGVAAYEAARVMAEQNLALGRTVVVDAVNDSEPARETWRTAAANSGARLAFVLVTLDDEAEHRRRLEGRVRGLAHVREPSWQDVRARASAYAPWAEGTCLRVDAAVPVDDAVVDLLDRLDRSWDVDTAEHGPPPISPRQRSAPRRTGG